MSNWSDVWLPRKSFEFGEEFLSSPSVRTFYEQLLAAARSCPNYGRRPRLEQFWAREHAAFLSHCSSAGLRYKDYLPGRLYTYQRLAELICKYVPAGGSVLELGCGSGLGLSLLSSVGRQTAGIDIAVAAVNYARALAEHFDVTIARVEVGDYFCPPPRFSRMFDLVFNVGALEHHSCQLQTELIERMASCSNGLILVVVPNTASPIYQTMESLEFRVMPDGLVYPEEFETFPVSLDDLSSASRKELLREGAIHLPPPRQLDLELFDKPCYFELERLVRRVRHSAGDLSERWAKIERACPTEVMQHLGWFKYGLYAT